MSRRPDRTGRPARQARARRLNLEPLEGRELLAMFMVTTAADNGNNASPTPGSLRAAIVALDADNTVGADSISFNIAASGVQTIALQAALPNITHEVVIDGATEPGFSPNNTPIVVLDGSAAGAGANGLTIASGGGGSIIRGLSIVGFTASATTGGGEGIFLAGTAGGNQIFDDYLGVEADGSTAKENGSGILVFSPNNTIGGTTPLTSDVISGNENAGVLIAGSSATGNVVTGNLIGVNAAGSVAVGNQYGVLVMASNNTIGGTAAGAGNVISGNVGPSGNSGAGILFEGQATADVVEGNEIGTNRAGTSAILPTNIFPSITYSNTYGIFFGTPPSGVSTDNIINETIGGTVAGAGNLISGNFIGITGSVASSVIEGNTVGLNLAGTAPISNGAGILLGASQTTIGGTTGLARNIISGSNTLIGASGGVAIVDGAGLNLTGDSDLVEGNFIGTASNGLAAAGTGNAIGIELTVTNSTIGSTTIGNSNIISGNSGDGIILGGAGGNAVYGNVIGLDFQGNADGNGGSGIVVSGPTPAPTSPTPLNTSIGGTTAGAGNTIAHSGGSGVLVTTTNYTGLGIRGNSIFGNAMLGIVTTTTNPQTPIPTTLFINGYSLANGLVTVTGVYFDAPGTTVSIDLFGNANDPSGFGQGPNYLGTVSVTTNSAGFATFSPSFASPLVPYTSFSATFTPPDGNTSEFTANFPTASGAPVADLQVLPSASSNSVIIGDTITLVETVANFGPGTANGVVLYDTLPASLVNVSVTSSIGTASIGANNVVTASIGTLTAKTFATVTITGTVSQAGTLVDQAGASSTTFDPNYVNNTSSQTITVAQGSTGPSADLAIIQSASPTSALVGSPLTYTITVGNVGPSAATNVTVIDTLPAGVIIDGITSSQGAAPSINGNLVTLNLGSMVDLGLATITIVVTPTAAGSVSNLATVSGNQFDPVKTNNSSTLTTTVSTATPIIHFFLAQSAFPATGAVGQFQAFTMTVENFGPNTATNVFLIDNLPAGATFYSATPSQGGSPTLVGTQLRENFGTLAAGAVASLQLIVIPSAIGTLTNVAGVYTPDVPSATPSFATSSVSIVAGPSVTALNGFGGNAQLVISFNEALIPSTATNPANFQLVSLGVNGKGTPQTIKIASITYNQISHSVMILPAQAINNAFSYKLTVVGSTSTGVTDALGRKLASSLFGPAGGNYTAQFFAGTLPQI